MIHRLLPLGLIAATLAACSIRPPAVGGRVASPSPSATAPQPAASPTPGATASAQTPSPAATATAPASPPDVLVAPPGAHTTFSGRIALDARYALAVGGASSAGQGALVAAHQGTVLAAPGSNLVGGNPAGILSHLGAGETAAAKLISNNGGSVISNNGAGIVSNNGGGILSDQGGGLVSKARFRSLQAAEAPAAVPVGGMLVGIQSLVDGAFYPLGVDAQGQPVYAVYTDANGAFTVHLPATLKTDTLLVVASVPGTADPRLAVASLARPQQQAPLEVDDHTTAVTAYLRKILTNRFVEAYVPDPCRPVDAGYASSDLVKDAASQVEDLLTGAPFKALSREGRRRVIQRLTDAALGTLDLEAVQIDPQLFSSTATGPALAQLRDFVAQVEGAAAQRLAANPHAFDDAVYVKLANLDRQGRPPVQILVPADLCALWTDEIGGSNDNTVVRREEGILVDLGLDVAVHARLQATGLSFIQAMGQTLQAAARRDAFRKVVTDAVADETGRGTPVDCVPPPQPPVRLASVTTLAGDGTAGFQDGPGAAARFNQPARLAVDPAGFLLVSDALNQRIRKIDLRGPDHAVSTVAGDGTPGSRDGVGAAAGFNRPTGLVLDGKGALYVVDRAGAKVRRIADYLTDHAAVTTLAGSGTKGAADGTGAEASFRQPEDLAFGPDGSLYVADMGNNLLRKVTAAGAVTTFAGDGGDATLNGYGTEAGIHTPHGIAYAPGGYFLVADGRLRKVTPAGGVTIHVGRNGEAGLDGTYYTADFVGPHGLAIDAAGNVYVADVGEDHIRLVLPTGFVTTIAGGPTSGFADGTGPAALFNGPEGVAVGPDGTIYVADTKNHRIRALKLP